MDTDMESLVASVEVSADDEIARITAASAVRAELTEVGDQLLDHFVGEARAAGRSWTEIGEALGVTRQAAQQRHAGLVERVVGRLKGGLFRRFDEPARAAVVMAQEAARTRNHAPIGTEHVLLGLLAGGDDDVAVRVLGRLGVERATVQGLLESRMAAPGDTAVKGHIPFSAEAKAALVETERACRELDHRRIGTGHMLLAIRRVEGGVASEVLAEAGVSDDDLRAAVAELASV